MTSESEGGAVEYPNDTREAQQIQEHVGQLIDELLEQADKERYIADYIVALHAALIVVINRSRRADGTPMSQPEHKKFADDLLRLGAKVAAGLLDDNGPCTCPKCMGQRQAETKH